MSGRVTRSRAWTKPAPKRPLTQSIPWLERFEGTSSAMRAKRPSARTASSRPHPTPQYGHVVSTVFTTATGASFGRSAPVGQVATHWPQEVQTDADIGPSPTTPTRIAWARPRSAMAPIRWTSPHATVQRPQRMQASRSRTKKDLESSTANRWSGANEGRPTACRALAAPS